MRIETDKERSGKTVLEILKKELRLSSKMITLLKSREDGIRVDGNRVTVRHILCEGEVLSLSPEDRDENENLIPTKMPLDILYETDDLLLINKPPLMPTHPSHGHFDDTLANGVCYHMMEKRNEPFVFRSVNRLDKNTSGLVLIAKNRISASRLYGSMQKGLIKKKYIALLCGVPNKKSGRIDTYIRRREASIITREICPALPDAAHAVTDYRILCSNGIICAAEASPLTGRTHQLRLHFAHIGAPILGDDLYGKASDEIGRQALHACTLSFPDPSSDEILTFTAPLPDDMRKTAERHKLIIEV